MENQNKKGFRSMSGEEFFFVRYIQKTEQRRVKGRWQNKSVIYEEYSRRNKNDNVLIPKGGLLKYLKSMKCAEII